MVRCVCGCACGVSGAAAWAGGDQMSDGFRCVDGGAGKNALRLY